MTKHEVSAFLRTVGPQLRQVRGSLVMASLCMVGLTLTDLLRPWPLKIIFDHILLDKPLPAFLAFLHPLLSSGKIMAVVVVSSAVVLIAALGGLFSYFQVSITAGVGNQIVSTLRVELFAHLQRLSLSFHNRAHSGELLTKLAGDTATMRDVFAESALTFTSQVLTVIGVFAIMFAVNWKLALIVLATFPLLVGNLVRLYRRSRTSARKQRQKEEKMASRLNEAFSTVLLVQAFGRERHEHERFVAENAGHLAESMGHVRHEAVATRAQEIIGAVGTCAVVLFGALQVLQGDMTPGSILLFTAYLHSLYRPMRNLTKLSAGLSKAMVSAGRIAEVLVVEPDIVDDPAAIAASNLRGEITFHEVSFDYGDGNDVLRDVSCTVGAGQYVALVGMSGSGKSTLVSLLLRLYDPQAGSISIDGVNIKNYRRESLRAAIGIVLQESMLRGASIRENIAYGKPEATMEEIVAAAKAANAHDFIQRLEDRYDTVIAERGATLSGGQRQRIAIARAMIRNPAILILDEPMTGLDRQTEATVRQALARLIAGKTCLLITHDLQAVTGADVVLFLHGGRLVARGRHNELMAANRQYREFCEGRRTIRPDWRAREQAQV